MAKILTVDDDHVLRALMKDMLEEDGGHSVESAVTAEDCLTRLRGGGFHLVILDVNMPQVSGMEVLRQIRRDPALRKLPVLMCTGRNKLGDIDQAFELGATGYIVKPFSSDALNAQVTKGLTAAV
jgi:two-component system chemotaxis response regulator CheY